MRFSPPGRPGLQLDQTFIPWVGARGTALVSCRYKTAVGENGEKRRFSTTKSLYLWNDRR